MRKRDKLFIIVLKYILKIKLNFNIGKYLFDYLKM
jgi:hypothetical protein